MSFLCYLINDFGIVGSSKPIQTHPIEDTLANAVANVATNVAIAIVIMLNNFILNSSF